MMTQAPQISDTWIAERWPNQDPAEVRRRFNALMNKLGETPWRGMPNFPEVMQPVLAWAAMKPAERIETLAIALADVPDHFRDYLYTAEKPMFGEQRVKVESVVGNDGHGMGRQAVAITPYVKGYNIARWIAAASPGNVGALLGELRRLGERIAGLLRYNNEQVEKRRVASALLCEAGNLFRLYEANHRAKVTANAPETSPDEIARNADATRKAERNAEIAGRIETFLKEIHQ